MLAGPHSFRGLTQGSDLFLGLKLEYDLCDIYGKRLKILTEGPHKDSAVNCAYVWYTNSIYQ